MQDHPDDAAADQAAGTPPNAAPGKALSPAARRALAEAAARRAAEEKAQPPTEIHGRGGLEPVRYGDWEIKGLTADF